MRYKIMYTNRMKHDVKLMLKRGKDLKKLEDVLSILAEGKELPRKHFNHNLTGTLSDFKECHIEPDWLLLYRLDDDVLILTATATGSHSDLFS